MQKGRRRKEKFHKSQNLALRLAGVMFVLVCVSTCMLSGLLAKYTGVKETSDQARVAVFQVEAVGTPNTQTIDASEADEVQAQYAVSIENESEVAVAYSVYVTFSEILPEWITVTLSTDQTPDTSSVNDGKTTLYFHEVGQMPVGGNANEQMTIVLDSEKFAASSAEHGMSYTDSLSFEVYVNAVQID